jgi:hypothetical protein
LRMPGGVGRVDLESGPVGDTSRRVGDRRAGGELSGAVGLEQVRGREHLGVLGEVADLIAGAADPAAGGQHPPVGQQQRRGVVLACDLLGRQRLPRPGGGVPELACVHAVVEVDEPGAGRVAAGRQHGPVGQHGEVVLPAPVGHRRRVAGLRVVAVDVDHPRAGYRVPSARDEDLAHVEEGVAAVITIDRIALAEAFPPAGAVRVQLAHRLIRPGVERTPVGGHVDPRVQRQAQRRGAQRPQRPGRGAHLRQGHATGRDQHLPVTQRRHARVPALARHVRPQAPRVVRVVEHVGLDDAVQ